MDDPTSKSVPISINIDTAQGYKSLPSRGVVYTSEDKPPHLLKQVRVHLDMYMYSGTGKSQGTP